MPQDAPPPPALPPPPPPATQLQLHRSWKSRYRAKARSIRQTLLAEKRPTSSGDALKEELEAFARQQVAAALAPLARRGWPARLRRLGLSGACKLCCGTAIPYLVANIVYTSARAAELLGFASTEEANLGSILKHCASCSIQCATAPVMINVLAQVCQPAVQLLADLDDGEAIAVAWFLLGQMVPGICWVLDVAALERSLDSILQTIANKAVLLHLEWIDRRILVPLLLPAVADARVAAAVAG